MLQSFHPIIYLKLKMSAFSWKMAIYLMMCCGITIFPSWGFAQVETDLGTLDNYSQNSPRIINGTVSDINANDWYGFNVSGETNLTMEINESLPSGAFSDICIYRDGVQIGAVQSFEGDCYEARGGESGARVPQFSGSLIPEEGTYSWPIPSGIYYFRVNAYQGRTVDYRISIWTEGEAGVELSSDALSMREGEEKTYTVGLKSAPTSDAATIVIGSTHTSVIVEPTSLIFTSTNWSTLQTVRVTAAQDDDTADEDAMITHAVSGLGSVTDGGTVSVTVEDDDREVVSLSVSSLTVAEGGSNSYTAVLTGEPDGQVTVTPSSDNPDVTFFPSSLSFDSNNWDAAQTVSVTANEDGDTTNDVATISHAVSGLGDTTDGGTVLVTVEESPETVEEQEIAAVTDTLATVASAAVSNVTTNIGARFSAARGGTNLSVAGQSFAQSLYSESEKATWESLWDNEGSSRTLSPDELLRSTTFQIALGAAEGEQGLAATQWTVWGRGDLQYFSSDPDRGSGYDGDLRAGYLGLDVQLDERWLAGIALAQTMASADYTLDGNSADGQGQMDVTLTSLLPYIRFAPNQKSELWAILGAGGGEIENIRPGTASSASETSDLSLWMASAGGRQALASEGPLGWALLGDMSFGRVETEDGVQAVSGLTVDIWRTRLGVEGSFTTELESGGSFTAFMEVAGRLDGGGDDDEEAGVEVSPGLYFSDPSSGFGVEVRGRALVLHSAENYEEYGVSATVSLSPRSDGLGLSLSLTPRWGDGTGGVETLWRNEAFGQLTSRSNGHHAMSLDTRVGYGVQTMNGVLTPFGEFGLRDGDSRTVRVGASFGRYRSASGALSLELSGEWRERASRDLEQRVGIVGRVRF